MQAEHVSGILALGDVPIGSKSEDTMVGFGMSLVFVFAVAFYCTVRIFRRYRWRTLAFWQGTALVLICCAFSAYLFADYWSAKMTVDYWLSLFVGAELSLVTAVSAIGLEEVYEYVRKKSKPVAPH